MSTTPTLDEFVAGARAWLAANAEPRPERVESTWGEGSDDVSVFHNATYEEDKAIVDAGRDLAAAQVRRRVRLDRLGTGVRRRRVVVGVRQGVLA